MSKRYRATPYQRIMREWEHGRGVHLTATDVQVLAQDAAIETGAIRDNETQCDVTERCVPDADKYCRRCGRTGYQSA